MRVFAPGKLVLSGAYAVLEGAPAIVVAVARGAFADASRRTSTPTAEVVAAFGDDPAPFVDAASMFVDGRKLGLGASAAILVASLASRFHLEGADLRSPGVRSELFRRARAAHAAAQAGGSGIDVAASVHGGALRYVVDHDPIAVDLPRGLRVTTFACAHSAKTSELRVAVDRAALADPGRHRERMTRLRSIAEDAAAAVASSDAAAFTDALRRSARALADLGQSSGVAIVPAGFEELEAIARDGDASFSVSGAGGGDVAVHLGPAAPSPRFCARARALGLIALDLSLDHEGVRIAKARSAAAEIEPTLSDRT